MTDPRYTKLAKLLVNYSTKVGKSDRVLLDMIDVPDDIPVALLRATRAAVWTPLPDDLHTRVSREIVLATDQKHASLYADIELARMKKMQAYIAIRGSANTTENSDVPAEKSA